MTNEYVKRLKSADVRKVDRDTLVDIKEGVYLELISTRKGKYNYLHHNW